MKKSTDRGSFRGSIGFVLAAAGSAVGLGNIWRFPYLAAKDGGGLFLFLYILLALTFGFTLLITEVAIGRKTKQSPLTAYGMLRPKWKWLGIAAVTVPVIILPYYCAIGGWVVKYLLAYLTGGGGAATADGYFTGFLGSTWEPVLMLSVFLLATGVIVYLGVEKGIEKASKIIMPILLLLILVIAGFSLTLRHEVEDGSVRTGLQGLLVYLVPDFSGMTVGKFFTVLLDAMGQLFFSLSVAMGIMITYGSYVPDDAKIGSSVNRIEIFDTGVALLAGVMIIPAVFTFEGTEGMNAGPGLMFVTLPKVFAEMGKFGSFVGALFFAMVLFAALTSAVSVMEAVVSSVMDKFGFPRHKAVIGVTLFALVAGILVCFGYNFLYFELPLPTGTTGQLLDVLDFVSNNLLMPVVAIGTCLLVGWVLKPKTVIDEVEKTGCKMGRKGLYKVMIRYIAPVMLLVLFAKSIGLF